MGSMHKMPHSRQWRPQMQSRRVYSLRMPERGVFAILYVVLFSLTLTVCGFTLALCQLYNRKIELQAMANAVALAAARELNGTPAGMTLALQKAESTAQRYTYDYSQPVTWTDAAISFSSSPSANDGATAGVATLFYATVDTSKLSDVGTVYPVFMQFISSLSSVQVSARAVAGRTGINVLPLAICALDKINVGAQRGSELVEYGFRRGVGYDLMNLNPTDTTAEHFIIDPYVPPGAAASTYTTTPNAVGPFVCTGTMWMPRITGGDVQVSRPFPINSLYQQLNSRFDDWSGNVCSPNGAPPDLNIRAFSGTWMSPAQLKPNAATWNGDGKLRTIADSTNLPPLTNTNMWGALWSYSKAVKWTSYQAGKAEPATGYATFATSDFSTLYQAGLTTVNYPSALAGGTPYKATTTSPTTNKKLAESNRRVLYVPLLDCPVPAGTNAHANVIAIGKFFMTVPATPASVVGEFAGVVSEQSLAGKVELYP